MRKRKIYPPHTSVVIVIVGVVVLGRVVAYAGGRIDELRRVETDADVADKRLGCRRQDSGGVVILFGRCGKDGGGGDAQQQKKKR